MSVHFGLMEKFKMNKKSHNKRFVADTRSSRVRYNPLLCGHPHWGAVWI